MRFLPAAALLLFATALSAQVDDKARQELDHVFDRPAGTIIQQEQKDKLAAWLQAHEGQDLGDLGYAKALQCYLDRDYDGAVTVLDGFFAAGHKIDNADHRNMAGRVYLNAVSQQGRADQPDADKLARWAEAMTKLYSDTAMLERVAKAVMPRAADAAALRVALAKGVFASELSTAQKDGFLQSLYADAAAPAVAATPRRAATPAARLIPLPSQPAVDQGKVVKPGDVVESFAIDKVIHGAADFSLTSCKGKVVVLDFFASWCAPCRGALAGMVELQKAHPDDLQVIGVTRYYGNGMDFSGDDVKLPHGGKTVKDLDHDQEAKLYESLQKAFGLSYPVVLVADQNLARERFGVTGIPTMFVIGRDGRLVGSVVGGGEKQHDRLLELVEQARK